MAEGSGGVTYAQKWRVGDVTITKVVEVESAGGLTGMIPQATPEALLAIPWLQPHFMTPDGKLIGSVHALIVQTPSKRIIVDTCSGDDKPRPYTPMDMLKSGFMDRMNAAGFPPESIDVVLCTHLHVDHVGWNTTLVDGVWKPTFTNARYLYNRTEYDYWEKGEDSVQMKGWDRIQRLVFADSVKPILDAGLADFVEPTHQICEEVDLVPTHGHSPGHVSVRIRSKGEQAFITGDMAHSPAQLAHPEWATVLDTDPEESTRTRHRIWSTYAGTPTLIIGTHWGGPTAGHINRDGEVYRLDV
ncbi:MAG: MBL fold metallo-hydrolase [Caulobacter sp.]